MSQRTIYHYFSGGLLVFRFICMMGAMIYKAPTGLEATLEPSAHPSLQ